YRKFPAAGIKTHIRWTIRNLIDYLIRRVVAYSKERKESFGIENPDDVRRLSEPVIAFPPSDLDMLEELKNHLMENVYKEPRTQRMVWKGQHVISRLFDAFVENGGLELLPRSTKERIEMTGDKIGVIIDYIAGMTDRHA